MVNPEFEVDVATFLTVKASVNPLAHEGWLSTMLQVALEANAATLKGLEAEVARGFTSGEFASTLAESIMEAIQGASFWPEVYRTAMHAGNYEVVEETEDGKTYPYREEVEFDGE